MNHKEKFINVLATYVQPRVKNYRAAVLHTEKHWQEHIELIKQLPPETIAQMLNYAVMGMHMMSENDMMEQFGEVVLDDIKQVIHDATCPRCKDKTESEKTTEDSAGTSATDARPEGSPPIYGSFEELIGALGGGKKPLN